MDSSSLRDRRTQPRGPQKPCSSFPSVVGLHYITILICTYLMKFLKVLPVQKSKIHLVKLIPKNVTPSKGFKFNLEFPSQHSHPGSHTSVVLLPGNTKQVFPWLMRSFKADIFPFIWIYKFVNFQKKQMVLFFQCSWSWEIMVGSWGLDPCLGHSVFPVSGTEP